MPRQKWRGISIFGMTNPYDPPHKRALNDAELAEALSAAQAGVGGALEAMSLLEEQSKLRAADAEGYVQWVRSMETDGSPEARAALNKARLANSGLSSGDIESESQPQTTEDSWKSLVPDWDERQRSIETAKEQAISDAKNRAAAEAEREIEAAVAAALVEAEFEAELRREEAIAEAKAVADAQAAQRLAEALRIEEEKRLEAEQRAEAEREEAARLHAEELAEQQRLEEEAAQAKKLREAEEFAQLQREEQIRIELEAAEAAAAEALLAAEQEAQQRAADIAEIEAAAIIEEASIQEDEPQPNRASEFATGSFDIVESAEQSATEEFDEENFDVLLEDGELGFAREPQSNSKSESTSTIERRSKPYSQLFVWSSITVGIAPILLAYLSLGLELTAIDRLTAFAAGFALSALLLSVVAIGGKRSGLSTLFLSRAAFGVRANLVPSILLLVAKLSLGSILVVSLLAMFNNNIVGLPEFGSTALAVSGANISWMAVLAVAVLVIASVLALFGGKVLYWAQLSVAGIGALAVLLFVAFTIGSLQIPADAFSFSGNWFALTGLVVLITSTFGALLVNSVADFTRKIPMIAAGKRVVLFTAIATGVLPFMIASYAALQSSALSGAVRSAALANPMSAILASVPDWLSSVLLISSALTLLALSSSWLYSSSVSLAAVSLKLRRFVSQPIVLLLAIALSLTLLSLPSSLINPLDAVVSLSSIVVMSWAGIFVSDIALRRIAYHEISLSRDYGFYRAVNWANIGGFALAVVLGLGFSSTTLAGFEWMGFIANAIGANEFAAAHVGALLALVVSSLFPVLFGRKRIKLQEQEVLKIESRKNDLDGIEIGESV